MSSLDGKFHLMNSTKELIFSFVGLVALIILVLSSDLFAAPGPFGFGYAELHEPMTTDRPDFTESTKTIQRGHLQGELGYRFTYDDDSDSSSHDIPETLLRLGVLDIAEARFSFTGYQNVEDAGDSSYGISDLSVGTKVKIFEACECNFELSTIFEITVPSGSSDLSQDDVSPKGTLLWAYDWGSPLSVSGNFNFDVPVDNGDYYFEPSASLSFGYAMTDKLGAYAEYFGFYPSGGNAPSTVSTHYLNGGFTYLLDTNLQLDILSGFGINDAADDYFCGFGLSFRI